MLENENESLRERVGDLEKKVYEQRDEILCLRATLADVLRRLTNIETTHNNSSNSRGLSGSVGTPNLPSSRRTRNYPTTSSVEQNRIDWRRSAPPATAPHNNGFQQPVLNGGGGGGAVGNNTNYNRPGSVNRGLSHHQSTGSLHSVESRSSNGGGGLSSPSPTPSPYHQRGSPSPVTPNQQHYQRNGLKSPLLANKRWSSTSDFGTASGNMAVSAGRTGSSTARSLLNLHVKTPHTRHGTKDATYNAEEGTIRVFLRGRPINLYLPNSIDDNNFSLARVATAPLAKLKLEWVYGYRGRDCRSNLYYLPTGELVYFMAAVVVLYNVEDQQQRHYLGHTDDVKCLAVHPNKLIVATGQCAGHDKKEGKAHVRVWNSVSLHTLHVIGIGDFDRSVSCISFSKADGGVLLCVIDESSEHLITVWDWQKGDKGVKLAENKCSGDTVVAMEFHPLDKNTIISCGKNHISFWTYETSLYKKLGIFESRDKPKYVTCLAFNGTGDVLSGDSSGNILIWARGTNVVSRIIRSAHDGPIFSIHTLKDGDILTGGGKDSRILQWDPELNKILMETVIPAQYGPVRAITDGRGSQLVVGTTRNCILAGSFQLPFQLLVQGHTDELWGLATHPEQQQFITGGHDKLLVLWDALSHTAVWALELDEQIQSATFSPDGQVIVVGTLVGHWFAISAETKEIISHHQDGTEPIQVVRYSPDGRMLAIGSRDNVIYMYQVSGEPAYQKFNRIGRCAGHSSFISHLDWSSDSTFLQSNSGDYELLYWNASVCRQIPQSSQMRDTEWSSTTCTLTAVTIGIWPENADGTDVNSCDRSHDKKLVVTGDDFGKVKFYNYPVTQPKSLCHSYGGHSSHVTNVEFLQDDTRVISAGGRDSTVIQWVVIS